MGMSGPQLLQSAGPNDGIEHETGHLPATFNIYHMLLKIEVDRMQTGHAHAFLSVKYGATQLWLLEPSYEAMTSGAK